MRLVTWNCQGAFRKKVDPILDLKPDILIIQECEHPDKLKFDNTTHIPKNIYWYSDGGKKGLAIFSYSDFTFELLPEFNPKFRYVIPFSINGNGISFTLFAIWAMNNKENYDARYIGQIWLAINYYKELISKQSSILIGDFNSNKIWDNKKRIGNHTDVVNKLEEQNIYSVYHKYFGAEQGREKHSTLFLYRKENKPYHIDYCFASHEFITKVKKVEIGDYKKWTALSDHSPLLIEFDL